MLEKLGAGSFGTVHKALDNSTGDLESSKFFARRALSLQLISLLFSLSPFFAHTGCNQNNGAKVFYLGGSSATSRSSMLASTQSLQCGRSEEGVCVCCVRICVFVCICVLNCSLYVWLGCSR